jgi:acetyl esterase/lipase
VPLHPQARQFIDTIEAMGLPTLPELSAPDARAQTAALTPIIGPGPEVHLVENFTIAVNGGSIAAREYVPEEATATIFWIHGGGWTICDLESHDAMCRVLANASGCRVLAVDYRLAPEHPFPIPLEDCWDALCWIAEKYPNKPLVLAGDSAGGNMTAVLARRARDRGGPALALQVLVYPATDFTMNDSPSMQAYGNGPETFLTAAEMEWFEANYITDEALRENPEVSPLKAESLAGLPPAIVVTAQYDPLCDQGVAYAERLAADGVPVTRHHYDDQIHAFFTLVNIFDSANEAVPKVGGEIRNVLASAVA